MTEFHSESIREDNEIDDTIPHPSVDELGLWSIDDPDFVKELDRRATDNSPGVPWSLIREESLRRLRRGLH